MPKRPRVSGRSSPSLSYYGDPSVLILTSLAGGNQHGYGLIKEIRELSGITLSVGTLYGALDRLEERGLIERLPAENRRNPYRLTGSGAAALREYLDSLERVTAAARLRLSPGSFG